MPGCLYQWARLGSVFGFIPTTGISLSCRCMAASFPIEEACIETRMALPLHAVSGGRPYTTSIDLSNSSAVLDGRPFDRQGGDVSLDEGVEAGNVSRVRLGCFQVGVGEDLGVQEVDQALSGRAISAKGG